jgi:arylsulfatase A-like enzyme/Flp pilus assembly protein TadD
VPSRRLASRCALLLALASAAGGCNLISADAARGPNVLLVTIDTLRADRVGAYGARDVATPTLDRLAARGVLFEQAMATVPLTLPSHASILTGQYPPTHGVRHNAIFRLADEAETVAERFSAAGFATGAVIGAAVLDPAFGLAQGFDHYDATLPEERSAAGGFHERPAAAVTDAALAWLRETDEPFFLWLHYYDVHSSYKPPEPFATRFRDHPYDGEAAYVDQELGRLLAELEKSERLAATVVAVTSDHGEGLGEHGEETHSYLIYESDLHVPLIIAGPGVPAGRRIPAVASNTGLAPTLLRLAGLPPLAKTDVGDLSAAWREGEPELPGWAYAESLAGELDHGWAPIHAIRSDAFHYIRAPRPELFSAANDPRQRANLLPSSDASHAEVVGREEGRITELLARSTAAKPVDVDAEMRSRIEALGYVVPKGDVVKTNADPKDVHRLAGYWYEALGALMSKEYERAEKIALQGLEKLPQSSQLHDVIARLYIETRRPQLALPHALEAARLNPGWSDYQAQVGFVYLLLGDLPQAVAGFERAHRMDPRHPGAHIGLMLRRKLGGSLEEADEHARQGLALDGEDPGVVERVAETWEFLGEYERALAVYLDAAERFPDHLRFQMRLAIQYARLGEEREARRAREKAGATAEHLDLRNRLGIVYAARREFDRAEPIFREILRERPEEVSTRRYLAHMLREAGRVDEAAALAVGTDGAPAGPMPSAPTELRPRG